MLTYNQNFVRQSLQVIPDNASHVLEIGGDMAGEVVSALSQAIDAKVVGLNPSPSYPTRDGTSPEGSSAFFLRGDGQALPFADNLFDAIVSVATLEHVLDLDAFLQEVQRTLKPRGVFLTSFSPIWSSAQGHHVFAVQGNKEARFWKPGKNPVPDFAHLSMTPEELELFLRSGPCTEELIAPIIRWIYHDNHINRLFFEDYLVSFNRSGLLVQRLNCNMNVRQVPEPILTKLNEKQGVGHDYRYHQIEAIFRKADRPGRLSGTLFRGTILLQRLLNDAEFRAAIQIRTRLPEIFPLAKQLYRWLRSGFLKH